MKEQARFTRQQVMTLVATVACSGVVFLDSSVTNIALPAIQRDLAMSTAQQQSVASGYLLTLSALLLVGGRLGDVYGRKRMFRLGLAAYAVLATAAAASPTAGFLIAARALQGVAGAVLVPTSLALVNASFPRDVRGRAIGVWSAWSSITTVLGPILGGLLIDNAVWRAALLITPLLALVALLMGRALVESRDDAAAGNPPDVIGALLVVLAVGGPVFALIQGSAAGWTSAGVVGGAALGVVFTPAFVVWESRARSPMVPLHIFRSRDLTAANVATMFIYAALYGALFYVTIYVQSALGMSATLAGAAFVPMTLLLFFLSPWAGRLNDRFGPRWLMTFGPLTIALGFVVMSLTGPGEILTLLLPGIVLMGTGLGFTVAPLTATAIGSAEERYSGIASGVNNAVSRVAALVAIAGLGVIMVGIWRAALTAEGVGTVDVAALQSVRDTAFVLPPPSSPEARATALAAAQRAYRDGMLIAAASAALGGIVSALWIRAGSTAAETE